MIIDDFIVNLFASVKSLHTVIYNTVCIDFILFQTQFYVSIHVINIYNSDIIEIFMSTNAQNVFSD